MRVLVVSDVHLDAPFTWAPPSAARARRRALRQALRRSMEVAAERRADAVLVAGDLYEHERYAPDTATFLRGLFADAGRPVFLAPGNHDWLGPSSIYRQVDWPANVHVFDTDRLRPVSLAEGLTLWGAAHLAPANTDGFLDGFSVDREGVHLALFHGAEESGLPGQGDGKRPHAPFRAEQLPAAGLHHAFVGHFHRPVDGRWHTYPGNPEPLGFGEDGPRGAVIADIDDVGGVRVERVPVSSSTVHDVMVDVTGALHSDEVVEQVVAVVAGLTGVVRVTVHGEVEPDVDLRVEDLRDVGGHLDAFVPRLGALTVRYDLAALAVEPTVRGEFVRAVHEAGLAEDVARRVLVTGLRALDGRTDLEVR